VAEIRWPRQLAEENHKLKQLVADLTLDKVILQEVLEKSLTPTRKRPLVRTVTGPFSIGVRRAGGLLHPSFVALFDDPSLTYFVIRCRRHCQYGAEVSKLWLVG
jgi:hypothetical protein